MWQNLPSAALGGVHLESCDISTFTINGQGNSVECRRRDRSQECIATNLMNVHFELACEYFFGCLVGVDDRKHVDWRKTVLGIARHTT